MKNPWFDIPLADYEGHMSSPDVGQASMIADILERTLHECSPASIAILGCAGGNGFERVNPEVTARVVGIDINPEYIAITRERFQNRLPGLELLVADLQTDDVCLEPVELVFAALLFEYVEPDVILRTIHRLLKSNGRLVTVVQLPKADGPAVTPSPFTSLQSLSSCLRLVPPDLLRQQAAAQSLSLATSEQVVLQSGKSFQVQTFQATPWNSMNPSELVSRAATSLDIDQCRP